jgi:hypothetical protein
MAGVKSGIAPHVLASQVRSTAGWLWEDPRAKHVALALEPIGEVASLRLLLAAHFATVGTFVPTDVDARIRHHVWTAMDDVAEGCAVVDEIAGWDPRWVSERVVDGLSGHDGEWLAVRAGALGRALVLGDEKTAKTLEAQIDAELDREERLFLGGGDARRVLCVATTIAHNLGDLSRVVEQWPASVRARGERWVRLAHDGARFAAAGALNTRIMANENHRFLALRKARGLRASRELLLPFGPWFDAWGERVAAIDGCADVVAALVELHLSRPEQLGCLRALAGIHRATRGGLEAHAEKLPARIRKEPFRGRIREAIDVTPAHFEARIAKRYDTWINAASPVR